MAQGRPAARAFVEIFADNRRMLRGLAQSAVAWRNFGRTIGATMQQISRHTTVAASGIVYALGRSSVAFADEEAVSRRFATVFVNNMDLAIETADRFASTLRMNKSKVKDTLVTYTSYWQGFGKSQKEAIKLAEQMLGLTYDLAAFKGISVDDAYTRLTSGVAGSAQALDQFGIDLRRTAVDKEFERLAETMTEFKGVTAANATEVQTSLARLNIIANALSRQGALGYAAKNLDLLTSTWNQLKDGILSVLQAIGKVLSPQLKVWGDKLRQFADTLNETLGENGNLKIKQWIASIPSAIVSITSLIAVLTALKAVLKPVVVSTFLLAKALIKTLPTAAQYTVKSFSTFGKSIGASIKVVAKDMSVLNANMKAASLANLKYQASVIRAQKAVVSLSKAQAVANALLGKGKTIGGVTINTTRLTPVVVGSILKEQRATKLLEAAKTREAASSIRATKAAKELKNARMALIRTIPSTVFQVGKASVLFGLQSSLVTGIVNGFVAARDQVRDEINKNYLSGFSGAIAEAFQTGDIESMFALVILSFKALWDSTKNIFMSIVDEFKRAFDWFLKAFNFLYDKFVYVWSQISLTFKELTSGGYEPGRSFGGNTNNLDFSRVDERDFLSKNQRELIDLIRQLQSNRINRAVFDLTNDEPAFPQKGPRVDEAVSVAAATAERITTQAMGTFSGIAASLFGSGGRTFESDVASTADSTKDLVRSSNSIDEKLTRLNSRIDSLYSVVVASGGLTFT